MSVNLSTSSFLFTYLPMSCVTARDSAETSGGSQSRSHPLPQHRASQISIPRAHWGAPAVPLTQTLFSLRCCCSAPSESAAVPPTMTGVPALARRGQWWQLEGHQESTEMEFQFCNLGFQSSVESVPFGNSTALSILFPLEACFLIPSLDRLHFTSCLYHFLAV